MNDQDSKQANGVEHVKGNILLLDDDKFLLDMYAMKFTQSGYSVQACILAKEALDVIRGGFSPDVILFDLTMPQQDGFSFLQIMKDEKLAPKSRKIALTNQSSEAERSKAMELGATGYIVKASMIPSEVVNTVDQELAKKGA